MCKSECFIIGVLFLALILAIAEKILDPWDREEDEPPRNIHQERSFWVEPAATTGTAIPSPSPEPVDFTSF